ncbi:hypothetical protein MAR_015625 [Mya arenaria]|uniref:Uncharacterized protein n=1 Tax=Mya arenaria TaxID=6604 RepID=A0ABY7FLP2_MYAAR|nr:hypothetical protein MAR_015625 [Mya arenaria]
MVPIFLKNISWFWRFQIVKTFFFCVLNKNLLHLLKHVSLKEIYCKMQGIIILLKDENRVNIYFLKERVFDVFFTKIF